MDTAGSRIGNSRLQGRSNSNSNMLWPQTRPGALGQPQLVGPGQPQLEGPGEPQPVALGQPWLMSLKHSAGCSGTATDGSSVTAMAGRSTVLCDGSPTGTAASSRHTDTSRAVCPEALMES